MRQIRVFIVEDSTLFRKILTLALNALPHVRVAGSATNGQEALQSIPLCKPDIITLDVNMPVMDGLDTLRQLHQVYPGFKALMVSSVTRGGAAQTLKALELGAYDFITKPELNSEEENIAALKKSFARILGADLESYSPGEHTHHATLSATTPFAPTLPVQSSQPFRAPPAGFRAKIVAIGTSTGGPNALSALLPRLPADFPLPILIVQHMPQLFTASFAEALNKKCALQVVEAQQGMALQAATAYVAPGGMQMKLAGTPAAHDVRIQLTDDPAEHFCKPSVDYLFRSVAQVYELEAIGVILTGMGSDGTLGLKLLKRRGAYTMCQDKHSCVVYGMPREAVEAGVIDAQLTLGEIASTLQALAPRV